MNQPVNGRSACAACSADSVVLAGDLLRAAEELATAALGDERFQQPPVVRDLLVGRSSRYDTSPSCSCAAEPLPLCARDPGLKPIELCVARPAQMAVDERVSPGVATSDVVWTDHERSTLALRLRLLDKDDLDVRGLAPSKRPLGRPSSVLSQADADLGELISEPTTVLVESDQINVGVRSGPPPNVEVDGDAAAQPQRCLHLAERSQTFDNFCRRQHERHSARYIAARGRVGG